MHLQKTALIIGDSIPLAPKKTRIIRICKIDCVQSIKQNADITLLVDYLAPNLLHLTEKCEIAYLRRGEVPAGERLPSSAQNYGFTRYCLAATVA